MSEVDDVIVQASAEATVQTASAEAAPKVEVVKEEEDIGKKPDSELTPEQLAKREANRQSHTNSKLAEMRRANRELQARVAQYEQPKPPQETPKAEVKPTGEPKLDDFETWEDYNKALVRYEAKQIAEAQNKQTQETQKQQEYSKWADERGQAVDNRIIELASTIPDFEQTLEEIEDSIPTLSPEFARIALEADDINLAAYTLHREGKLQDVLKMPPSIAAKEIAKAEIRGEQYLKQKPTTGAPAPLTPARGNVVGSTSIEKMDGVQLLRSLRKKG